MWRNVARREPVAIAVAGLDAAVVAVLTALMSLGWITLTGQQLRDISAAVVVVSGVFGAILRAGVVSPETHENAVVDALMTPVPSLEHTDEPRTEGLEGIA